ncbi:UDP-N-acetylmuramate:L-alanyl-gamma-D-glutamyl-meso-diaminopimelate ligase [Aliidiomarina taiwanensis]|uniref:UDP-N-acetylmuramate:L-alanyl-gamma-D-glutamyl-meso-diaminopimelate ligase n=2 Tax=Aliidiomarina taiwanensis TaxID=946228 RepID=A0A432X157_9GAMM|nr:UDP-N-acetylmuramate:L-alanyl-gamma-D-glutamyl-meso-diaminopimelate ligase [Aliidiomarina taiwanensis]
MGGVAALARELGFHVTGWDANVYPPMSTQLEKLGIELTSSLSTEQLEPAPDLVIIGNAMSRGHPLVEYVLEQGMPFQSGPEWLGNNLLRHKHVLAVAGTHGKTTTASMLTFILEQAGLNPSFLVGGVVKPFGQTARLTDSDYFVIEADEYDTAFFDKRSKFLHYYPNVFTINNLEFDHADIFADLNAIQTQFAHGIRLVPGSGSILAATAEPAIDNILQRGYWSKLVPLNNESSWSVADNTKDGSSFSVLYAGHCVGHIEWSLLGEHNMQNALIAIAAADQVGVPAAIACTILNEFEAPARRMELLGVHNHVHIYDDFAHHPTAIATTLHGLREKVGAGSRIVAIFEPRSNTMKAGVHGDSLMQAFEQADRVYALQPADAALSLASAKQQGDWVVATSVEALVERILAEEGQPGHWVIMSNGGFGGIHQQLLNALQTQEKLHDE